MRNIQWDAVGDRIYETGVDRGVHYLKQADGSYKNGVAWNGLSNVSENPSGAEPSPIYADNIKYLNLMSAEEFGATVEAYTYPEQFEECDGSKALTPGVNAGQQKRSVFGLAYRTKLGNDVDGEEYGYKLHLLYGALASPSEKSYQTVNDSPEAISFSWELSTTPVEVAGMKPTATLTIDSTKVSPTKLADLENILYGVDEVEGRLPLPDEVLSIMVAADPDPVALSSSSPTDEDVDVAIDSVVVLTFNNVIVAEQVTMASAAGDIVAGTKAFDATNKILTFTPDAVLTNGTDYIVTIAGVVDENNQTLATEAINFTTIA